ncbi:class I SAM-dependent methyltransferase [Patescibacteria group bacterium]
MNQLNNLLTCPKCKVELKELSCLGCGKKYEEKGSVPIFIDDIEVGAVAQHQKSRPNSLKRFLRFLKPPHHSVYFKNLRSSYEEGPELEKFMRNYGENDIVVNVGSLSKKIKGAKARVYNLDIAYYPNIDIVADAHELPFKDGSLDGVIIKNVFEHLRDPAKVRDELRRVVKNGGRIYAKVPFMQPFHAVPDDYQRYSINGLKEFFKDFKIIEEGISVGPSSALAWFLREYLAILFSFNSAKAYKVMRAIFSYFTAPIKYFDAFFRKRKEAHRLASAFYLVLEK